MFKNDFFLNFINLYSFYYFSNEHKDKLYYCNQDNFKICFKSKIKSMIFPFQAIFQSKCLFFKIIFPFI